MRAEGANTLPAEAIQLSGARFAFGDLEVLDGVDLGVAPGETVALVGESGCGKSTLLELVVGLREPGAGTVAIGGDRTGRLAHAALMPQRDSLLPWLSAIDNAALAPRNRGASRGAAREEAAPLLRRFGLEGFERADVAELSGGMRQRVAFARTLLSGKPILALDEPFASLDAITRAEMQEWLAALLPAERRTIVLVTHDVEEALYLADRVVVLSPRPARVVAEIPSPAPRSHPRTEAITSAPFVGARERAMQALEEGRHAR